MQRIYSPFNPATNNGSSDTNVSWPLFSKEQIRALESAYSRQRSDFNSINKPKDFLAPEATANLLPTLMESAGQSLAKLCLALAPNANQIWIACGPGNNGGDGLVAAIELKKLGKNPYVSFIGQRITLDSAPKTSSIKDHLHAQQAALDLGIELHFEAPSHWDFVIDALLGIGLDQHNRRPIEGTLAAWLSLINTSDAPVLCADTPSAMCTDTGQISLICGSSTQPYLNLNQKRYTLTFLGLKPGLFTGMGKDLAGEIWLDQLDAPIQTATAAKENDSILKNFNPVIYLNSEPAATRRSHSSHKGTFSDVVIVGGAKGMQGAAVLAATSALHMGAGRVYLCLLDEDPRKAFFVNPALMTRPVSELPCLLMAASTVVCGCGGGQEITKYLPNLLPSSKSLVIDADALNAVAADEEFKKLLIARSDGSEDGPIATVLTPHPLEAARLLGISTKEVQDNRVRCARELARFFRCTVVLKGSGTVIAQFDPSKKENTERISINPTGCAILATAGTGDVLAGMIGALLGHNRDPWQSACEAVFIHGQTAQRWGTNESFDASSLAERVTYPRLSN